MISRIFAGNSAGITLMLVAMALLPIVDSLSKLLSEHYPAEQITFVRNFSHAVLVLPLVVGKFGLKPVIHHTNKLQAIRSLCFIAMTGTYIVALSHMPLADALAITFMFPFIIVILSPWFLGETPGLRRWIAVIVGFAGTLFIIRPGFGELNSGVPFAIAAAGFTAGYVLLTRKLAAKTPSLIMLLQPALLGSLVLLIFVPSVWINPSMTDAIIMVSIGAAAALVHFLIVLAYQHGEASQIAPLTYVQMVVAASLGFLMFGDLPDLWTTFGILLIATGGTFIAWRENRTIQ